MKITEEPASPEDVALLNQAALQVFTRAAALAALNEAGCACPERFLALMERSLRCVHTGFGDFEVLAVDEKGEVRAGAHGAGMTPVELAWELERDPSFREIWKNKNPNTR